jgi:hypothetical protein
MRDVRNPNGTYNGIAILARLSGLSEAEVAWTAERLRHLRLVEGRTVEEAKAIVAAECQARPWEQPKRAE